MQMLSSAYNDPLVMQKKKPSSITVGTGVSAANNLQAVMQPGDVRSRKQFVADKHAAPIPCL